MSRPFSPSIAFPELIAVDGSGSKVIDGIYKRGGVEGVDWSFSYEKQSEEISSNIILCYGEELPELGGPGCVGWVIAETKSIDFIPSPDTKPPVSLNVLARCIRRIGDAVNTKTLEWSIAKDDGNWEPVAGLSAKPVNEDLIANRDDSTRPSSPTPSLSESPMPAIWPLARISDRLKYVKPSEGISSDQYMISEKIPSAFRFVLYPFGTSESPPGCVSLEIVTESEGIFPEFVVKLGGAESGVKTMTGRKFHVDFSRNCVMGSKRLEGLVAELLVVD